MAELNEADQATHTAILNPRVGDHLSEMCAYTTIVIDVHGDIVTCITGGGNNELKIDRYTYEAYRYFLAYNSDVMANKYWVSLRKRDIDVTEYLEMDITKGFSAFAINSHIKVEEPTTIKCNDPVFGGLIDDDILARFEDSSVLYGDIINAQLIKTNKELLAVLKAEQESKPPFNCLDCGVGLEEDDLCPGDLCEKCYCVGKGIP